MKRYSVQQSSETVLKKIAKTEKTRHGFNVIIPFAEMTKEIENMEITTMIHKLFTGNTSFGVVTTKRTNNELVIVCQQN